MISDDGSSDFPKDKILDYISEGNCGHIKNVIINVNERNMGTVKHLNKIIPMTSGKYISFFAADDAMYSKLTVTNIVNALDTLQENEYVITSQLAMYDGELKELQYNYVSDDTKTKLYNYGTEKIFSALSLQPLYPAAGTCFKRELFEKYGYFDERYTLIEDWTFSLKLSRLGVKYHYYDFIGYKHRDGGVSHSDKELNKEIKQLYHMDLILLHEIELFPYINIFDAEERLKLFKKYGIHVTALHPNEDFLCEKTYRYMALDLRKLDYRHCRDNAALKEQLLRYEDDVNKIKNSTSWRITAPLRAVAEFVRATLEKYNLR